MYHYIRDFKKKYPHFKNFLAKKKFHQQLDYFIKDLGIISSEEEFTKNANKYLLTFDDGLKEQVYAAKILAKKKLTGIFFIPTIPLIKNKFLDVHKIHLLIGKVGGKKLLNYLDKNSKFYNYKNNILFKTKNKFSKAYSFNKDDSYNIKFKKYMNYFLDKNSRSKILNDLFKVFKINEKVENFYMSKSDISQIKKLGMIIGSHGHSHQLFSKMNKKEQNKEIVISKKFLEKITKSKIRYFCYPFGRKYSFNSNTFSLLKKNKFKYAFSVTSKDTNLSNCRNKLELPRYDTNEFIN